MNSIPPAPGLPAAQLLPTEERAWKILCVDDEPNILSALRRLFRQAGYQVTLANSGAEGLQCMTADPADLVISDMRMPEMDGAAFLSAVREHWPETVRILLTGYSDMASTVEAINRGEIYRYIAKPWEDADILLTVRHALERKALEMQKLWLEALTRQQNDALRELNATLEQKVEQRTAELRHAHDRLKLGFLNSIRIFSNLIDLRQKTIAGHSRRVAELSRKLAVDMQLHSEDIQHVFIAGLLHDIGKIGFPDQLLAKPQNQMTTEEQALLRQHPASGEMALMSLEEVRPAAILLRHHHERFDGKGYPDGLAGQRIPPGARILALANDYDAYQIGTLTGKPMDADQAKAAILDGRWTRYDPEVVEAFLHVTGPLTRPLPGDISFTADALMPGMVLSRDLLNQAGLLMLAAGHRLTARIIRQIQDLARSENQDMPVYVERESVARDAENSSAATRP